VRRGLAVFAFFAANVACWILGHRQGQRVPLLGGFRCPDCGAPVDLGKVDPFRKTGSRDPRFPRRGA